MKYLFLAVASFFLMYSNAMAADPFTVTGVPVDATGATAIEAQTAAISTGQLEAAQILIRRLTLDSQRSQVQSLALSKEDAAKLIRALEIANEKRSGRRYLGDITVAFNPNAVQALMKANNLQMISTQARPRLVLPVLSGSSLWRENAWQAAWRGGQYGHALTPIRSVPEGQGSSALIADAQVSNGDIDALRRVGEYFGLSQILIAETRSSSGRVTARLKDVSLDSGQSRDMGQVSANSYPELAAAVVNSLETDWKNASVSVSGKAVTAPLNVLYSSQREWQSLQDAINGSAQIQEARLDALSKDGAMMTVTYGGDFDRLRNELSFKGVAISQADDQSLTLSRSRRR